MRTGPGGDNAAAVGRVHQAVAGHVSHHAAKHAGAFDYGGEEIRARDLRIVAEPQTLFVDSASGARTMLHELEGEVDVLRHTFAEAEGSFSSEGFHRNKRSGHIYAVSPHHDTRPGEVLLAGVKGPRRGMERHELADKYELVERTEARAWWDAEYTRTRSETVRVKHGCGRQDGKSEESRGTFSGLMPLIEGTWCQVLRA